MAHKNTEINQTNKTLLPQGKQICRYCRELKDLTNFHLASAFPSGRKPYCKPCCKTHYYDKEETRIRSKRWRKENPDGWRIISLREKSKPHQKLRKAMKRRINDYLKATQTEGQWRNLVSCTPKELILHLESQFTTAMSWANYGTYWHMDHIIPCAAFDWTRPNHLQWCWHHKNLRPLPARENEDKCDFLSTGENASQLKKDDLARLTEIVGADLERLGIATASEFESSMSTSYRVILLGLD